MRGFSLQLKMDLLKYWSWWLYFSSRRGTFSAKNWWEFFVDVISCFVEIFFFRKEKRNYAVTSINRCYLILPRIQHNIVLLVLRTVFAIGFWLLNLLQLKLWANIPLEIGESPSAVVLYLCVNFHKCISVVF